MRRLRGARAARLEGVHEVGDPAGVVRARAPARRPEVHLVGQRVREQAGHDVEVAQRVAQVGRRPGPYPCARRAGCQALTQYLSFPARARVKRGAA